MGSVLGNIFNPIGNLLKGDARSVADPLKAFGDPNKPKDPPPEEPDFLASYQAGVDVDTASLAQRRLIDTAAQLGGVYADGRIWSQDEYQKALKFENDKLAAARASGDQTSIDQATTQLGKLQGKGSFNFQGGGSADLAQQQLLQEIGGADQTTKALLDLESKYGPEAAQIARKNLEATDPTGFALREQAGNQLLNGGNSIESLYGNLNAPNYESLSDSSLPQYQRLGDSDAPQLNGVNGVKLQDTGAARAGRGMLEQQVFDELAQAGQSDPALQRAAEQAARARGASSGNILGDSSALQESLQVQLAQRALDEKRRSEAAGLLSSGQTTSDKDNELAQLQLQNDIASTGFNNETAQQGFANKSAIVANNNTASDQAFNAAMSAINQRNQTAQNTFAGQSQIAQQRAGARQQDTANTQSFLGLQPVSAQAGGYDNVSAPFNPGNVQVGTVTNPGAGQLGAEWYSQLYGAQNQIDAAGQQASAAKSSGLMSAGAGIAGAAIIAI